LYSALKSGGAELNAAQKKSISKMTVSEKLGKYFGTICFGVDELINSNILSKGEKLPCSNSESFYTTIANQTAINVKITEAEQDESDPKWVKIIHEQEMKLPSGRNEGMEIKVTYSYDLNQVMNCIFLDVATGDEMNKDISFSGASGKSTSAIDRFLVD